MEDGREDGGDEDEEEEDRLEGADEDGKSDEEGGDEAARVGPVPRRTRRTNERMNSFVGGP